MEVKWKSHWIAVQIHEASRVLSFDLTDKDDSIEPLCCITYADLLHIDLYGTAVFPRKRLSDKIHELFFPGKFMNCFFQENVSTRKRRSGKIQKWLFQE